LVLFLYIKSLFSARKGKSKASSQKKTTPTFATIKDQYTTLEQVTKALQKAGLEACQLIVAVDFTKSNLSQGKRTFGGKSLHTIRKDRMPNPYEKAIFLIGKTLKDFDDDGLIPTFGFGDLQSKGRACFPFNFDSSPCRGFEDVLERYREIAQSVTLSGPTNFAPVIHEAIKIVKETQEYHVLLIVCDGQVTSRRETEAAIVEASKYPLQICIVGVGDGPWDEMEEFDDELPTRTVDNLQFVDSSKFLDYNKGFSDVNQKQEAHFAVAALQELPDHYKACKQHRLM